MPVPALVQQISAFDITSPKNPTLAFTPTSTASILVALLASFGNAAVSGDTVSDNVGNVWTAACTPGGFTVRQSLFYCLAPSLSTATITGTFTDATLPAEAQLRVVEFAGCFKQAPFQTAVLDQVPPGNYALYNSGTINVQRTALLVGAIPGFNPGTPYMDTACGFTPIGPNPYLGSNTNIAWSTFGYKIVNAPGNQSMLSFVNNSIGTGCIAAFQCEDPPTTPILEVGSQLGRGR